MAFDSVNIPSGGTTIPGELYKPSGTAATGLVVIAYGAVGWTDPWTKMMQGYAEDLAGRGLFALMPDYFARTGTTHGGAAAASTPKALVEYFAPRFLGIEAPGHVPFAQIHHGTGDEPPTEFANAAAIATILRRERSVVEVCEYKDATHGFASPSAADATAAVASKASTLKFFANRL